MSGNDIKAIAFCLAIGSWLLYRSIKRHRQARKIEDTPTSKVASAPQGFVELEGFAWPAAEKLPTPSGMEAVYYSFRLEKKVTTGSGKNRRRTWICVYSSVKGESFYLADPTGLALVNLYDAELNLAPARTRNWRQIGAQERKVICESILTKAVANFPPSDFLFGIFSAPYRVVEHEIYVGSPVLVQGDFRSASGDNKKITSVGLGQFASRVFDIQRRAIKNLNGLLDTSKNGEVSHEESKRGYSMIARVSMNKARIEQQVEKEFELCGIVRASDSHRLLLSDAHQQHLLGRMQQYLWLQFGGGAALLALGLTASLNSGFRFERLPTRKMLNPSSISMAQRKPTALATAPVDPRELHSRCVAGDLDPCVQLVQEQNQFHLSSKALTYYQFQSCRLGKKYCK
jgi:hypothetical protein